jgi:predicted small secreted protein
MNYKKRSSWLTIILLLTSLLSACAGYGPSNSMIGSGKDHIVQVLGKPSTELQTADGQLLIYSKGPFGKETFFVYLNRDGGGVDSMCGGRSWGVAQVEMGLYVWDNGVVEEAV